jgi:hypothetical protein
LSIDASTEKKVDGDCKYGELHRTDFGNIEHGCTSVCVMNEYCDLNLVFEVATDLQENYVVGIRDF